MKRFALGKLNLDCVSLNAGNRTVAVVSPQGHIDWLLPSPESDGPLLEHIDVEPHLSRTRGLKLALNFPDLAETITAIRTDTRKGGTDAVVTTGSSSRDGAWRGRHSAVLSENPRTGRYEWDIQATLECVVSPPRQPAWIEMLNVYPGRTGRGMLYASEKHFASTIVTDAAGKAWRFPHQHSMHYGDKLVSLRFAPGTMAGFVEEDLNPLVTVLESTLEPDWGICDMYYDLHVGSRVAAPVTSGDMHRWHCNVRYIDRAEASALAGRALDVGVSAEDYRKHYWPRLSLGRNDFANHVAIDEPETAFAFPTSPPEMTWERESGPGGRGALCIRNPGNGEKVWSARPPAHVPPASGLRLFALVKTLNARGRGAFLRMRPHAFHWRPERHFEWFAPLESVPVTGTHDWTVVHTPVLRVDAMRHDCMVWIDFVLDGEGEAWLADMDVDLQGIGEEAPVSPRVAPVGG